MQRSWNGQRGGAVCHIRIRAFSHIGKTYTQTRLFRGCFVVVRKFFLLLNAVARARRSETLAACSARILVGSWRLDAVRRLEIRWSHQLLSAIPIVCMRALNRARVITPCGYFPHTSTIVPFAFSSRPPVFRPTPVRARESL